MTIGPGVGFLIGMAWAENENAQDFSNERARVRRELSEQNATSLGNRAVKDAARAVLNAVLDELAAEGQGRLKVRRLSDPENVAGRNEAFMDTAEGQLRRLSEGTYEFSQMRTATLRSADLELKDALAHRNIVPKAELVRPPKQKR